MGVINDYGMPFTDQAGDRKYNSSQWREYFGKLIKDGIIQNAGNEVTVKQQAVANKSVFVDTGTVFIQGVMRILSSTIALNCADNTSGNPRIDRIVARLNYTTRAIEFAVKQGTPAASPVAPSLTRNTSMYELALADITLANGFSTIITANINDKRWDVNLCGAASMTIGVIPPSGLDAVTVQLEPETAGLFGVLNVDQVLKILACKNIEIIDASQTWVSPDYDATVNVLCVGGGGGGAGGSGGHGTNGTYGGSGGGGGASGGVVFLSKRIKGNTSIPIVIGAGGSAGVKATAKGIVGTVGTSGGNTSFADVIALGGNGGNIGKAAMYEGGIAGSTAVAGGTFGGGAGYNTGPSAGGNMDLSAITNLNTFDTNIIGITAGIGGAKGDNASNFGGGLGGGGAGGSGGGSTFNGNGGTGGRGGNATLPATDGTVGSFYGAGGGGGGGAGGLYAGGAGNGAAGRSGVVIIAY